MRSPPERARTVVRLEPCVSPRIVVRPPFDSRAAAIRAWSTLKTPDEFITALDTLPWRPPTVFLMRRGANDTYTLRLASDVYPNQPNVRRYQVALDAALFDDPRFTVSNIGPFVLAIRHPAKAAR